MSSSQQTLYMEAALNQAELGAAQGEVPVGAVVVYENKIIAAAHNLVETTGDPTAHAEILALRGAANALGRWRLHGAALYVTLEPCPMCIGAILLSRLEALHFGALDPTMGAVGSVFDLSCHSELPLSVSVSQGLLEQRSRELLKDFFKLVRQDSERPPTK